MMYRFKNKINYHSDCLIYKINRLVLKIDKKKKRENINCLIVHIVNCYCD